MSNSIDYVVPMVFPEDKDWQYDLLVARGMMCDTRDAVTNVRYRSWGTERLLVQCVRRFMPWVRDIIILLARRSQVQPWMKEEGVRVVLHREFMPKEKLPTFNSSAFEMYLHRIPGLSEYFVYGNDDMFPLAPLAQEDFFRPVAGPSGEPSGTLWPCQHHNTKQYPGVPNNFQKMVMNGLNFVAEEFGQQFTTTWLKGGHSIAPLVRSTCEHLWERGGDRISAGATTFRMTCNFNQYIYSFWHHLSGQYFDHVPARRYVSASNTPEEIADAIRTTEGVLCVNDNEAAKDVRRYAEVVRSEIEARLRCGPSGEPEGTVVF